MPVLTHIQAKGVSDHSTGHTSEGPLYIPQSTFSSHLTLSSQWLRVCGCAGLSSSTFPSSSASVGSRCLCGPLWRLPWRLPGRCRRWCTEACLATQSCCALHQTRQGPSSPLTNYIVTSLPRLSFLVSLTFYSHFSQAAFSYFPPRLVWLRPREEDMNDAQNCPAILTLACCPWPKPELFCSLALRWTLLQSDYCKSIP